MNLNRAQLIREVEEILSLPYSSGASREGSKIVNAIIKAMVEILRKGETLTIHGLGYFKLHTGRYPSNNTGQMESYNRIIFHPSPTLIKELNEPHTP